MSLASNFNYRNIFFLSALLWLAQQFYAITIPLIVYEQTQSALDMSIARAMEFIPNILIAPIIGYWVDIIRAKKMLLISLVGQLISLIMVYALFSYYSNNQPEVKYCIYLTIIAFMGFVVIFNNIRNVMVKSSVPTELLTSANAYLQSMAQVIQVCGPILSGLILLLSNMLNGILICVGCLFASILLFLNINFIEKESKPMSALRAFNLKNIIFEPLKMVIDNKPLLHFTILGMIINIAEGISGIMYFYFFKSVLLLNSMMVGMFFSVIGIGAVAGALISPFLRKKFDDLKVIGILFLMLTLLYFSLGFVTHSMMVGTLIFFQSAASMIIAIYIWSIRQEKSAVESLGRIVGITSVIFKLGMPIAIIATGIFVSNYKIDYAFYVCAMVCIVAYIVNLNYRLNKSRSAWFVGYLPVGRMLC